MPRNPASDPKSKLSYAELNVSDMPPFDNSSPPALVACLVHSVSASAMGMEEPPIGEDGTPAEALKPGQFVVSAIRASPLGTPEGAHPISILCRVNSEGDLDPLAVLLTEDVMIGMFASTIPCPLPFRDKHLPSAD